MSEPNTETPDETPDETPEVAPDALPTPVAPPDEQPDETPDETGDEPEPEPAPEQPQALSQKQMERALDKLDREATRHHARVTEIMGDDVSMLLDCPMCDPLTPGKVMPSPQTPERFPAVREFMGDAQPAEYQRDPNTRTCVTCNGEGMVETGSRVDTQRLLACTDCGGKGWQGSRAPLAPTGPAAPALVPESNGQDFGNVPHVDSPEVAALKAKGYVVIEPPPRPTPVG